MSLLKQARRGCLWAWLLGLACLAAPAQAADRQPPWNLAMVVDLSPGLSQPWLGTTRRAALEKALDVELRSLPLRVTLGLWAPGAGGVRELLDPRPARGLKGYRLDLPLPGPPAALEPALEKALAWLKGQGGGSLLLLAGGRAPNLATGRLRDLARAGIFLHVLALEPGPAGQGLQRLTQQGGGLYLSAPGPHVVARQLRRVMGAALSPASLVVLAYDKSNRPQHLAIRLERPERGWPPVAGLTHRPLQLPLGVYHLAWPQGPPPGGQPAPDKAALDAPGLTRLWIGGQGQLSIAGGQAGAKWRVKISRQRDGQLIAPYRALPLSLSLPSGHYLVRSQSPAHQWGVLLTAGGKVKMEVGPPGRLNLALRGPLGPVRVAYQVHDLIAGRRVATGYTNSPLSLLPGSYRLELDLNPPEEHRVTLAPGQKLTLGLKPVGLLHLRRGAGPAPRSFEVQDPAGRVLARGIGARRLPLRPGRYRVIFQGAAPQEVTIKPGQVINLSPPRPAKGKGLLL